MTTMMTAPVELTGQPRERQTRGDGKAIQTTFLGSSDFSGVTFRAIVIITFGTMMG
jgi:hypothetical protein